MILAVHADQALSMLVDPTPRRTRRAGAIRFQTNQATLHTDTNLLSPRTRAWAAWNYDRRGDAIGAPTVTYDMTTLQRLRGRDRYLLSLNSDEWIDPRSVIESFTYAHPIFDHRAVAAQQRFGEIDGAGGVHYCGAWWGHGFHEDGMVSAMRVCDILTRKAFENTIVANSAIGGSTNAPIHINAIARHVGVKLVIEDWEKYGYDVPLLVNMQPAGKYLGEEYFRAGGLPAVMHELLKAKRIHADALTINGKTIGENVRRAASQDADVIKPYTKPLKKQAGFLVLKGNLFNSAIMKTSVISEEFRTRYLSNPKHKNAFEGRAVVFDGPRTTTTASTIRR